MAGAKLCKDRGLFVGQRAKILLLAETSLLLLAVTNTMVERAESKACLLNGLSRVDVSVSQIQWIATIDETILTAKAGANSWREGSHRRHIGHSDVDWGPLDWGVLAVAAAEEIDGLCLGELELPLV